MAKIVFIFILMFLASGLATALFMLRIMGGRSPESYSDPDLGILITDKVSTNQINPVHSKKYYFWFWLIGTLFLSVFMLIGFLFL